MPSGRAWKIVVDGKPLAIVCVQDELARVVVLNQQCNALADSPVSEMIRKALAESSDLDDEPDQASSVPEDMQPGPLLAWATWRAMRAANRSKVEDDE